MIFKIFSQYISYRWILGKGSYQSLARTSPGASIWVVAQWRQGAVFHPYEFVVFPQTRYGHLADSTVSPKLPDIDMLRPPAILDPRFEIQRSSFALVFADLAATVASTEISLDVSSLIPEAT